MGVSGHENHVRLKLTDESGLMIKIKSGGNLSIRQTYRNVTPRKAWNF